MKMNLGELMKNYPKAKCPQTIQKELNAINNLEKDLNSIDPNYKENLFDKLLNSDKNVLNNKLDQKNKGGFSGIDLKNAFCSMISLSDKKGTFILICFQIVFIY